MNQPQRVTCEQEITPGQHAARQLIPAAIFVVGTLAVVGGLALLYLKDPAEGGFYPPCLLHYFTGLHCPGCGTLRALHQLLHGHLAAAWAMNPLAICLLPGLTALFICGQVAALRQVSARVMRRLGANWIWVLLFVIVAFGLLRNVPAWPCTLLAPH